MEISGTCRLGIYNGVGSEKGLWNSKPIDIKTKYSKHYKLEYPSISNTAHRLLQKHYYLDIVDGKNNFVYLTPYGENGDEKDFSVSFTFATNKVHFGSAGKKLRVINDDVNTISFDVECLGTLTERGIHELTKTVPGKKRVDLLFGPNCKSLVKLFKNKVGVEDINDDESWMIACNTTNNVLNKHYIDRCSNRIVHFALRQLLDYYSSSEFKELCEDQDNSKDLSVLDNFEGKSYTKIIKIIKNNAYAK